MIPIPAGCARFLCYGWIITGVVFVLGLNKNGEDLSGAGLMAIGLGVLGLYVTRPGKSDMPELSDELAALLTKLYPTQLRREADEGGGVTLSFITNNRLYQLFVQTEDSPTEFTLSAGTENPYLEVTPGVMQAFVAAMRKRFPSASYGPRGPHGADFGASAHGRKIGGLPLEAEFLRCKQGVDLCLDGQSAVIRSLDGDD